MYALYLVGPIVERLYGPVRFVGFYVVAAIFASLTTFAFGDAPRGTGASGAIFGLFGILFIATPTAPSGARPGEPRTSPARSGS